MLEYMLYIVVSPYVMGFFCIFAPVHVLYIVAFGPLVIQASITLTVATFLQPRNVRQARPRAEHHLEHVSGAPRHVEAVAHGEAALEHGDFAVLHTRVDEAPGEVTRLGAEDRRQVPDRHADHHGEGGLAAAVADDPGAGDLHVDELVVGVQEDEEIGQVGDGHGHGVQQAHPACGLVLQDQASVGAGDDATILRRDLDLERGACENVHEPTTWHTFVSR